MTGKTTLADDPRFQYDLAMAESTLQSGELWIRDAFHRAEQHAIAGGGIDPAIDNDVRQSTTFLTQRARACRISTCTSARPRCATGRSSAASATCMQAASTRW